MATVLIFALLLDAALGEPKWLWGRISHPAVQIGRIIHWLDARLNAGSARKARGVLAVVMLSVGSLALGVLLSAFGPLAEIVVAAVFLAQRSLCDHVRAVADALRVSLGDGQRMVARIVGRDTRDMDTSAVARAAIESASENLSDGVVAPAFWFLIAGLPGLILYKSINTADSMIGYRTPRYEEFGWAAARLDDLLNLVPSRLTAAMIALPTGQIRNWSDIAADARRHRSPNAGWPESAMARALNIALAGPRSYHGKKTDFAYVHPQGRKLLSADDVDSSIVVLWKTWTIVLGTSVVLTLF